MSFEDFEMKLETSSPGTDNARWIGLQANLCHHFKSKLAPANIYVKMNTVIISCDFFVNLTGDCANRANCMAYVGSLEVEKVHCCPLASVRYVQVYSCVVHVSSRLLSV